MSDTTSPPPAADAGDNQFTDAVRNLGLEDDAPDIADTSDADEARGEQPDGVPSKDKLKVNGREIEQTYEEIKKAAQLYHATQQRLEQAKQEVQAARQLQEQLTGQQNAVRQLLGVVKACDIDTIASFAADYLGVGKEFDEAVVKRAIQLYNYQKMSPEQRRAVDNEKLVSKLQREAEERSKAEQTREHEYAVARWSEHIAVEVPKAIALVGLPDAPFVREQIISVWRAAIERGQTPTASAVAEYVKKRLDEAKMNLQPATAPTAQPRRKATRESVGLKSGNGADSQQGYMNWSEWTKSRGKG